MTKAESGASLRRVATGGSIRVGGHVFSTGLSVLTAALTLRYLGPRRAGLYYEALAIVAIASSFSESGLGAVALREYSVSPPDRRAGVLRDVLSLRLLLLATGVVLAAGWVFATERGVLAASVAVAGLATLALVAQSTLQVPLLADGRIAAATTVQVGVAVGGAMFVVALVAMDAPLAPFLGVFLPGALVACLVTAHLIRPIDVQVAWRPAAWRRLLKENLEYAASAVLGVIWLRSGPLLVSVGATTAEIGFYGVAFRIVDGVETLGPLVLAVALPNLSRLASDPDPSGLRRRFGQIFRLMAFGGLGLGITVSMAAGPMLRVLAGDEYAGGIEALRLMALVLPLAFMLQTCGYVLLALRRQRHQLLAMIAGVAVVVPSTIVGAEVGGARGAAAALVSSHVVVLVVYAIGVVRTLGVPKGTALDVLVLVVAAASSVALATSFSTNDVVRTAVGVAAFTAVGGGWVAVGLRRGSGSSAPTTPPGPAG